MTLDPSRALTTKQFHIFKMLAKGYAAHEIAESLGIYTRTVRHHLRAIRCRLRLRDVPAVVEAAERWLT